MQNFLNAVTGSYGNYEEQIAMLQRAMKISSEELFEANAKLREEGESQKKVIANLSTVVASFQKNGHGSVQILEVENLNDFIEKQSKEIVDISRQREALMKNLKQKNQVLSDYAHMVSHDLKSPLRNIDSLVNWIKEENESYVDDNCSQQFDLILRNLEKMDDLINGILRYSTIDDANSEVYDVNTHHLVYEIIEILDIPKHIKIEVDENLPVLRGDKFRLQQLFKNLLHNAIKSVDKPKGKVQVKVEDKSDYWEFCVSDNGKGIPKEYQNKIFQIFEKIENDQVATGIGLSIVKKIVDYYEGEIQVQSEVGQFTSFFFTIPKKM
ncbi:HAMP domain-containing sensor histidine kinase [uncultured Sunxiuqinia sp.]|uniref:sensor histidine kinase n=1 Tax=uncultured Sunxiuqinia sp. TaxID=1573825 RepID=UPI002AA75437|nr:HAMP domain-containing sensor histidine kinase [uncultured Sunxiuqinia sp.]